MAPPPGPAIAAAPSPPLGALATSPHRSGSWRAPALLLAVFLGLALAMFGRGVFGGVGSFPGSGTDPALFMWDLEWVPFALGHHLDPLVTTYIEYPSGANLMWNTSIVFPALVMAPVTLLWGPVLSYGVLTVLAVSLSAWCGALAVRRFTARWVPAAVGGLLYGFSPYMVAQALRHPHLDITVYPPLALIIGHELLVRRRRSPLLLGALLGVASAAQLLTGEELLALTVLMVAIVLATLALLRSREVGSALRRAGPAAAAAAASFAVLAAYPLDVQLFGPQRVTGRFWVLDIYKAGPREFVQPSALQWIAPFGRLGWVDTSVYIGVPLILLTVGTVVWLRRRAIVRVAAVALVAAVVLALGDRVQVGGVAVPMPWALVEHLPLVADALPIRMMLFGFLALAVLVGVFLDAGLGLGDARLRVGAALAALVALVPLIPSLPYPASRFAIPAFFTDGQAAGLSQAGSVLLTPYAVVDSGVEPLLWQAVSAMSFRTEQGLAFVPTVPPSSRPHWGAPQDALGTELTILGSGARLAPASLTAAQRQAYLVDLRAYDVQSVVVGPSPGEGQVARFMSELLGRPGVSTGGVVVWYHLPVPPA